MPRTSIPIEPETPPWLPTHNKLQTRLLIVAGLFLFFYSLTLTLSPAARTHTWQVTYRWDHWIAFFVWCILFSLANFLTSRWLPGRDPYLLPVVGLLSGWGLLSIWRLYPNFGQRQTIWLFLSVTVLIISLRMPGILDLLRRYKYLLLTAGLVLTMLTLLKGVSNPGNPERLGLTVFGIYFQPSEPLKLLLITYLAAYLADRLPYTPKLLPLLAPTLIMVGITLALLVFQRDLGTASIFIFLYTIIVYVASGRKRILLLSLFVILAASLAGYALFDVVRLRVDAWLNPWLDPSGRSFQIVQSLIAIANGGLIGRGPGLGNPALVPVAHSDFIYAAIGEETGLTGEIALLALYALFTERGLHIALQAKGRYQRLLAAGLTAYIVAQSILIIGGTLRMLPLTGVTLPFVSYGGSSLLASFLSLALLLHISARGVQPGEDHPAAAALLNPRPFTQLGGLLITGLAIAALTSGWWSILRSDSLLSRTDNPRRAINDLYVLRGFLVDRNNKPLVITLGKPGDYSRHSMYPPLGSTTGYTQPTYGQSGLEASMDPYLRGVVGNPPLDIWWNHLLYGQSPPGLDVRITVDLRLQDAADQALGDHTGALVLLNAKNGEILAMASHPTFDPNKLDSDWQKLVADPRLPLFNRSTLGQYQPGGALEPLLLAGAFEQDNNFLQQVGSPGIASIQLNDVILRCAEPPGQNSWSAAIAAGCPSAGQTLGELLGASHDGAKSRFIKLYTDAGLYSSPAIRLPVATASTLDLSGSQGVEKTVLGQGKLLVSPLQMALAAAVLSNDGKKPAVHLIAGVNMPQQGWTKLTELSSPVQVVSSTAAQAAAENLASHYLLAWQSMALATNGPGQTITWYLAGSLPSSPGSPFALALVLEEDNPALARQIGQKVLEAALQP